MDKLSSREREVILLAAQGLTDNQISHKLTIAPRTVRKYLSQVRDKVGALNTTHAVYLVTSTVFTTCIRSLIEG